MSRIDRVRAGIDDTNAIKGTWPLLHRAAAAFSVHAFHPQPADCSSFSAFALCIGIIWNRIGAKFSSYSKSVRMRMPLHSLYRLSSWNINSFFRFDFLWFPETVIRKFVVSRNSGRTQFSEWYRKYSYSFRGNIVSPLLSPSLSLVQIKKWNRVTLNKRRPIFLWEKSLALRFFFLHFFLTFYLITRGLLFFSSFFVLSARIHNYNFIILACISSRYYRDCAPPRTLVPRRAVRFAWCIPVLDDQ